MSGPVDTRGNYLAVGTWVVYSTNNRDSGLQFGHVHKIKSSQGTQSVYNKNTGQWERVAVTNYKIQLLRTDAHGAPIFEQEYDEYAPNPNRSDGKQFGAFVTTDKQSKSGFVEVYSGKFLAL